VRNARDYDPLNEEKLDTILRRRFGLLLDGHLKKFEVPRAARADLSLRSAQSRADF
jgi:hypothetical protein